jgi:hypothetical protein
MSISGWVEECIAASWGDRRAIRLVSNFPAGCSIPKPAGVARSSKLVLGFWARAKAASKETRLVMPPIGI